MIYAGDLVSDVIKRSCDLIKLRNMKLLNEPFGGRFYRPFPYLSILLSDSNTPKDYRSWDKLKTYESLDNERKSQYESYTAALLDDFAEMDYSFISTALPRVYRHA